MPPYGAAPPWPMPPYGAPPWPMPPYPPYPGMQPPQPQPAEQQAAYAPPPPPPAPPAPKPKPADFDPFAELTAALNPEPVEDDEPEPMPRAAREPEPEEHEALSDEDLDRMLGPQEEPVILESLTDSTDALDDDGEGIDDLDDIPDPEPIPEVFRSSSAYAERQARGGGGGGVMRLLLMILLPLVLIGGIGAGLFFASGMIVQVAPFMAPLYAMVGIETNLPGEGLMIRDTQPEWAKEGDKDVLMVRGVVANVSDVPRDVPQIRIVLYDSNNEEVQSAVQKPEKAKLEPAEEIHFKVRLENPSALARRVEVMFLAEEPAHEGEMKEGGGHG